MNSSYEQLQIFGTAKVLLSSLISSYSIRESENIIRILVEEITGHPFYKVKMEQDLCFSEAQYTRWKAVSEKIIKGEPLQYALGKAWFMDLELQVGPGVLVPRPETEELAELAIKTLDDISKITDHSLSKQEHDVQVLDIGTGSGCLAIYLAKELPKAKVYAIDISEEALNYTQKNALIYKVYIETVLLDILKAPEDLFESVDLIISNPPYIPISEKSRMEPHVTASEPEGALFVPDEDPLLFYRMIAKSGKEWLQPWGCLLCETHEDLANETAQLFQALGYQRVEIHKDLQGKERMVRAFLQIT